MNNTHEDQVFALKQTIAKLKHEIRDRDDRIALLKQGNLECVKDSHRLSFLLDEENNVSLEHYFYKDSQPCMDYLNDRELIDHYMENRTSYKHTR